MWPTKDYLKSSPFKFAFRYHCAHSTLGKHPSFRSVRSFDRPVVHSRLDPHLKIVETPPNWLHYLIKTHHFVRPQIQLKVPKCTAEEHSPERKSWYFSGVSQSALESKLGSFVNMNVRAAVTNLGHDFCSVVGSVKDEDGAKEENPVAG